MYQRTNPANMSRKVQIEAMLAESPKDAFLRFALAKEFEKEGADAGAREIYEALLADQPEYVGTYYHLGKTLERLNEQAEAWRTYTEGIAITKRLGEKHAMNELAGARLELGDEEDFA
jgi:predicted Zn-dependent protease